MQSGKPFTKQTGWFLSLLGLAITLLAVKAQTASPTPERMAYLTNDDWNSKGGAPPQCLETDQNEYDMAETVFQFWFFTVLWFFLFFIQIFRSSGVNVVYTNGFAVIAVSIFALAIFVHAIITNKNPCGHAVAVCSTISCVCANVVWQGYVWMFVVLVTNAILSLRVLGTNMHTLLFKEDEDNGQLPIEPSMAAGYLVATGTIFTTLTGIMPSMKADPLDNAIDLIHTMDTMHLVGVVVGAVFICLGCLWARMNTWYKYKETLAGRKGSPCGVWLHLFHCGCTGPEPTGATNSSSWGSLAPDNLKEKRMLAKAHREDKGIFWDFLTGVIVMVYVCRFGYANLRPFPATYTSHLCMHHKDVSECHGLGRDLFHEKLEPWPCQWINRVSDGLDDDDTIAFEVINSTGAFEDSGDCDSGCCFTNHRCFDERFAAAHEQWGLNDRPDDNGRCPWKANAASITYEYILLIYLLQVLMGYLCSKVNDEASIRLGYGDRVWDATNEPKTRDYCFTFETVRVAMNPLSAAYWQDKWYGRNPQVEAQKSLARNPWVANGAADAGVADAEVAIGSLYMCCCVTAAADADPVAKGYTAKGSLSTCCSYAVPDATCCCFTDGADADAKPAATVVKAAPAAPGGATDAPVHAAAAAASDDVAANAKHMTVSNI